MEQARQRKHDLDAAVKQTRQALERGDTAAASQSLSQILEIDPRHPAASELSAGLNTVFRSQAEDALRSMRQARAEAEKAKATTAEGYAQAAAFAKEGEGLFASGEFASATRAFLESRDGFDRVRRAARAPLVAQSAPPPAARTGPAAAGPPVSAPPGSLAGTTPTAPEPATAAVSTRRFVTGNTVIVTRRARRRPAGLRHRRREDSRSVPDFVGRIEFEMVPLSPAPRPGLLRAGLSGQRRQEVRAAQGGEHGHRGQRQAKTPAAFSPLVREVAPTQRALVAETRSVWAERGVVAGASRRW